MPLYLYFAADLSHAFLSLPSPPPPSLWIKPAATADDPRPKPAAAWLLTPATLARVLHSAAALERRHAAGDYPVERMVEVRDRLRPLVEWAIDEYGSRICGDALDALEAAGGPRRPLQPPAALPPSPFDPDYLRQTRRWNPTKCRFEDVKPSEPIENP